MNKIILGKIGFTDGGVYSETKTFKRYDFVETEDSSYVSLKDGNKGHPLTDPAWWKPLAKGIKATEAAQKANAAAEAATTQTAEATRVCNDAAATAQTAKENTEAAVTIVGQAKEATKAANDAAEKANTAATTIDDKINPVIESDRLQNTRLLALERYIPDAMSVEAPEELTLGNKESNYIKPRLLPEGTIPNVLYLSDNRAVEVEPDGRIKIIAQGVSVVQVIPTFNTKLAKTISIKVTEPTMRMGGSHSEMRFTSTGGIKLN